MTELNIVYHHSNQYIILILSMDSCLHNGSDWNKKRQQAQPFINRIRSAMEKKTRWIEQIGFLRRCQKEGLTPKGLRVKLPMSISKSHQGERVKARSEKRVLKKTISDLFVKIKAMDMRIAGLRLQLRQDFGFSVHWIQKMENWVMKSLGKMRAEIKKRLLGKLRNLRVAKLKQKMNLDKKNKPRLDKKVVYNFSSKKLTEEQLELLSLGLNFGIAPRRFPLVEYVTATELLCQRLEEAGDDESQEKARMIRNEVFLHLKRGYKMKLKSNLSPEQRQILKELKEDDSIIICPADKGKAVVVEDRETYLAKTQDQIHEGNYELSNKNEKTILRKLHRKIIDQLRDMGITEFKEQRRYTVTGPVMASMALLIKVHKQNFPGRAYVSQIDDPSYKVCEELTRILNPIDEKGDSFIRDTYHFKEMLDGIGIMKDDLMGTLDIVGMFPNIPVKKTLEVVREELLNDDTLGSRTKWEIDDIIKLLEITIETYFKTLDGKIYFQRDGLPIGKSISKPYIHALVQKDLRIWRGWRI